ncbi:DnaT-like ssDNA-binding domain-containing protein [Buchnera aphidicola]|uniref:Replication restart protein DnaT n=1 Tax=Buchnera aphidicola (Aphis nerii) TaxID=1241835 RepID=A0A4D6Y1Y6_9GAMM|nr:DnaT-like ssDNA-binding domain-containing protein [Buchnera aphidicola]QCI18595.1 primosomal protein DnaI [Buchnera aphidicola (Aphis nerii)]
MKILVSKNISLDLFCKNPTQIIKSNENSTLSISENKKILFYVITPSILKKIFNIEYNFQKEDIKKEQKMKKKFSMYSTWTPDKDFIQKAALWGIILEEEVSKHELNAFINYWEVEGCFFYHVQWEQKLARSLQRVRSFNILKKQKDITYIPEPDQKTPEGFRGK